MAVALFDKILADGVRSNQIPGRTQEAREWFRDTAKKTRSVTEGKLLQSREALTNRLEVGKMFLFSYDPKTKADLPYYDTFPLIFPIKKLPDGFLGLNLHYLPYVLRAKLMDLLYAYVSDPKLDDNTKLKISYSILNNAATNKYIAPCIKRYLSDHVRSKFIAIVPVEWDIALFLPVQRFQKATSTQVWRDSTRMVNKGRR
jgi:hypothetical protein